MMDIRKVKNLRGCCPECKNPHNLYQDENDKNILKCYSCNWIGNRDKLKYIWCY